MTISTMLQTDLRGKVNNMPDFKSEALTPVFEAISNSIHAIEATVSLKSGMISLEIIRDSPLDMQPNLSQASLGEIVGFKITDNGIGLDDKNYQSFITSDSTHKLDIGGKGIGRFTWLKAFNHVHIDSIYQTNGTSFQRCLNFSLLRGIEQISHTESDKERGTTVHLSQFKKEYQKETSAYKTTTKIAQRILEHCLAYYINNCAPNIIVYDEALEDGRIELTNEYEEIKKRINTETVILKDQKFELNHVNLTKTHLKMHNIVLCANNRAVKSISIANKLGTSAQFDDAGGKFIYALYISSAYLDRSVDSMRQNFNIPEKENELPYDKFNISFEEIECMAIQKAKIILAKYLEIINEMKKALILKHISQVDPTLRAVLTICPEVIEEIETTISPEKLSETLYRFKGIAEIKLRNETKRLISKKPQHDDDLKSLRKEFRVLAKHLTAYQKDNLTGYIIYRKRVIELLDKQLKIQDNGKYPTEDVIHNIIFPRYKTSDNILPDDHNLWLIDEQLTFHTFAFSEYTFPSSDRADILIFSEMDTRDRIARDVSIIELKRPQREDLGEEGLTQIYRYIDQVNEGKIILPDGRPLLVDNSTHYFCYLICDINDKIKKFINRDGGFAAIKNQLGYYKFNSSMRAHIEILAFDKLVSDVTQRHKIFFSKLMLPDKLTDSNS